MFATVKNFLKRLRPEDPRRIHEFREKLMPLCWDTKSVVTSLSAVFYAVEILQKLKFNITTGDAERVPGCRAQRAWQPGCSAQLVYCFLY